jgi:conjugal transfer pilin signal peptidase TrbI
MLSQKNKKIILIFIGAILFGFLLIFVFRYRIGLNISGSLPNKFFLVDKFNKNIAVGDYVNFIKKNDIYLQNDNFTKKVLGIAGDKIILNKYQEPINNIQGTITINNITLEVKDKTKLGTKVNILNINSDTIPENKIFVYSDHPESYDSRYNEFGLVDVQTVIGVAKPLF